MLVRVVGCEREGMVIAPDMKEANKRCCMPGALQWLSRARRHRGTNSSHLPQLMSKHTASVTLSCASGCSGAGAVTDATENMQMVRSVEPVAKRDSSQLTATVMMLPL